MNSAGTDTEKFSVRGDGLVAISGTLSVSGMTTLDILSVDALTAETIVAGNRLEVCLKLYFIFVTF